MNTKGMKFLAVLAVLAMAFAAFAVIAPAETDDAAEPTEITSDITTAMDISAEYVLGGEGGTRTLSATLTIKDGGVLDIGTTSTLTIAQGGLIIIESGGKLIATNGSSEIIVTATSGTVIDVRSGGVLGYAEYDDNQVGNYTKSVEIFGGAAPTSHDNLTNSKNCIVAQDVTGPFVIGATADGALTIEGTVSAATVSTAQKYSVPRINFYGESYNGISSTSGLVNVVTTGDLTIGAGVFTQATGLTITDDKYTVAGIQYTKSTAKDLILGTGATYVLTGIAYATAITIGGTTVLTVSSETQEQTTPITEMKGLSGMTVKNVSEALQISGSLTQTFTATTLTAAAELTVAKDTSLTVGSNITLAGTSMIVNGDLTNNGTTTASGTLTIAATGSVTNNGIMTITGATTNGGQLTNTSAFNGAITNNGIVTNTSVITGALTNNGAYEGSTSATSVTGGIAGNGITYAAVIDVSSENDSVGVNVTEINSDYTTLYYSQSEVVKVKSLTANLTVFVNNGVSVEFKFGDIATPTLTIITVAGDRLAKEAYPETGIVIKPVDNSTFEYTAAAIDYYGAIEDDSTATFYYSATVVANGLTYAGETTAIAPGEVIVSAGSFPSGAVNFQYGIRYTDDATYVYTSPGADAGDLVIGDNDSVRIVSGSVNIIYEGTYAAELAFSGVKEGSITVTTDDVAEGGYSNQLSAYTDYKVTRAGGSKLVNVAGDIPSKTTLTISGEVQLASAVNGGKIIVTKDSIVWTTNTTDQNAIMNKGTIQLDSAYPVAHAVVGGSATAGIFNQYTSTSGTTTGGTILVNEAALWTDMSSTAGIYGVLTTSTVGLIDTTGATAVGSLNDDIISQTIYKRQTYHVTTSLTVTGVLQVNGILIVDQGVTLTIAEGAKLIVGDYNTSFNNGYAQVINNGTIVVKVTPTAQSNSDPQATIDGKKLGIVVYNNATFKNAGTINTTSSVSLADGYTNPAAIQIYSAKFTNSGTINLGASDVMFASAGSNSGTMNITGEFLTSADFGFGNSGTITLNGAKVSSVHTGYTGLQVKLSKLGAVFDIKQVQLDKGSTVSVNNTGAYCSDSSTKGKTTVSISVNSAVADGKHNYIGSMKFVSGEDVVWGVCTPKIILSGAMSTNTNDTSTGLTVITDVKATGGRLAVEDTFALPSKAAMEVSELKVDGALTALTGAYLTVDKLQSCTGELSGAGVEVADGNFARYYGSAAIGYVYTSLPKAVAAVADLTNKLISINGSVSISEDLTIPAGYTIAGSGILSVGSYATLTIAPTASYSAGTVKCSGTVYAEVENNISSTVYADVKIQDGNSVTYTNFANGVASGETFTLLKGPSNTGVEISSDLEIPAGRTIDLRNATNTISVYGADLTVNGTLLFPRGNFNVTDGYTSEASVEVGGFFKLKSSSYFTKWWAPAGVQYTETINNAKFYVTTSVANIGQAVTDSDNKKLSVVAETIPDVTLAGSASNPAELTIYGKNVKTGTLTISNATVKFGNGIEHLTTKVANADGAIAIVNANPENLKFVEDGDLTMSGDLYDPEDVADVSGDYKYYPETYSVTFTGETNITKFAAHKWDGDYTTANPKRAYVPATGIESPSVAVDGILTAVGRANTFETYVTVNGFMYADNSSRITFADDVYVLGTLAAMEKDSSSAAGVIFVNDDIYIGATKNSLINKKVTALGGAVLSGDVTITNGKRVFVVPGSTVDDSIIEDLKFAIFQIEDVEFLRIYTSAAEVSIGALKVPLESGVVEEFDDANGDEVVAIGIDDAGTTAQFSNDYRAFIPESSVATSEDGMVYNAIVDFAVYTVMIKTDASIKAVYIDGALMTTSMMANVFMKDDVVIGKHTITVEPVTGYDASKCYLYLDDGTKLTGMTFIFDESDCKEVVGEAGDVTYTVTYNVAGTELVPEPTPEEQSEWTITTILLVILVILIAVMAVIVAIRLNRS